MNAAVRIRSEVGAGGRNRPADVRSIQSALNRYVGSLALATLKVDGQLGAITLAAIRKYQRQVVHLVNADGLVRPQGPTLCSLNAAARPSPPAAVDKEVRAPPGSASGGTPAKLTPNPPTPTPPPLPVAPPKKIEVPVLPKAPAPASNAVVKQFLVSAAPVAKTLGAKYGIPPSVILAVGALESNWGRARLSYFGEKLEQKKKDSFITAWTSEFFAGSPVRQRANFKYYATYAEAAEGFCKFIRRQPRYAHVFDHPYDVAFFIKELAKAGYATDPNYERKLLQEIAGNALLDYDK